MNGTCSNEIKGNLTVSLNALHLQLDKTPPDEFEVFIDVMVPQQPLRKSKRIKGSQMQVKDFFQDEFYFPNVRMSGNIDFFVKTQSIGRSFPEIIAKFSTSILELCNQNLLDRYKTYYFMNRLSHIQVAIDWLTS